MSKQPSQREGNILEPRTLQIHNYVAMDANAEANLEEEVEAEVEREENVNE